MKKYFPLLLLLGCAAVFILGLIHLFTLRFTAGDVYPPYSSLRSDPLGTMAFYESLGKVPGLLPRRDFSVNNHLPDEPRTVYLHLAADPDDWEWLSADVYHELEEFLMRGNRLVIAFFPQTESFGRSYYDIGSTNDMKPERRGGGAGAASDPPAGKMKKPGVDEGMVNVAGRWEFGMGFEALETAAGVYQPAKVVNRTDLPLPHALDWHSGMIFTNLGPAWHVIYARDPYAVVAERSFSRGSIVLASDSYFLSNEALANDRHAVVLAWLVGPNSNVVFDEAHLGVAETSGVAVLMRQYHLQAFLAGVLLLAGLFVWKNSSSLVPPAANETGGDYVAGRGSTAGFVNLLRRNVSPAELLALCFAEWKKSSGPAGPPTVARRQLAQKELEAAGPAAADVVATYQKICSVLKNRNAPPKL